MPWEGWPEEILEIYNILENIIFILLSIHNYVAIALRVQCRERKANTLRFGW